MRCTLKCLLSIYLLFLLCSMANAQDMVQYDFNVDTNPTAIAGNIASSTYDGSLLSGSYIGDDGFGDVLQSYPSSGSTDAATALANNSYFTITINAVGGQTFDLDTLSYKVGKGGDSDPRGYFIRSSLDGYTSDLYSETLPLGSQQAPALRTVPLAGFTDLTTVTFRFYIFTPSFDEYSVDWSEVSFLGSAPIPSLSEWGTILLFLLLAGLSLVMFKPGVGQD